MIRVLRPALAAAWLVALACALPLSSPAAEPAPEARQAAAAGAAPPEVALTAGQIVEKNLQARGGLEAWRRLDSIFWKGHLESDRFPQRKLGFELTQKRPNKVRFEILDPAEKSLRVFDGDRGWKVRAGQDGRPTLQAFSAMEVRYAREAPGPDGPLLDSALKGRTIELVGREKVEDRDCYRLAVSLAYGERQTVWVDAQTFLELRYDRTAYGDGAPKGIVSAYYRDYRVVEGLAVPSMIEIGGQAGDKRDRMVIENVAFNPKIPDAAFARPPGVPQSHEVVIQPPPLPRAQAQGSGSPSASPTMTPGAASR
jgi:outer membrane lipoprotein-sorting protein